MKTKIIYNGEWFDVIEKEDDEGIKTVGIKCLTEGVVILPYILNEMGEVESFGVNYEKNLLKSNNYSNVCIIGEIKDNEDALYAAKRELLEKTGFEQKDDTKWEYLGSLFIPKFIDSEYSCFAVNITGLKEKKKNNNTKNEKLLKFKMITPNELILEEDSFILSMIMKFFIKNYSNVFQITKDIQSS